MKRSSPFFLEKSHRRAALAILQLCESYGADTGTRKSEAEIHNAQMELAVCLTLINVDTHRAPPSLN